MSLTINTLETELEISPFPTESEKRIPGSARGEVVMDDSFFDPLPAEILECFFPIDEIPLVFKYDV